MSYVVLKTFRDRESGRKYFPDQPFDTEDKERIDLLLEGNYIEPSYEDGELKHVGAGYYELPNGEKVRGKEKAEEALKALQEQTGDDADVAGKTAGKDQKGT